MNVWTSREGLVLRDLVPSQLRRRWVDDGYCPDRDLYSLFAEQAARHPDRQAVVDDVGVLTYRQLRQKVRMAAGMLAAAGLGCQDVVGTQLENGRYAVIAELAVAAVGAVCLPIPAGQGEHDLLALLNRARARAVLVSDEGRLDALRDRLPHVRWVFATPWIGIDHGPLPTPEPEAPARFLASSGSETAPKMVAYSHNAMAGGRANYLRAVHGDVDVPRDLVLVPLSSSYGSFGVPATLCRMGGTLLLPGQFDPVRAMTAIAELGVTHVFGVPTMFRRMATAEVSADLSSLHAVVSSGDALPPQAAEAYRQRFGVPVVSVYGSSDGVNCHTREPARGAGFPDPAVTSIRIRGGEIQARGPMTPLCYVGDEALDARYRLPGGWVRTGDIGRFDRDGRLHLLGRARRVILRGDHTISAAEVERELAAHHLVTEVACVPVPDPDLGERLCACVVAQPGAPTPQLGELTGFLTSRGLEPWKLPERLMVLPELPLGATGKVCLHTLSRLARDHHA